MADIYLRSVPSDADPDDVRLYDPAQADAGSSVSGAIAWTQQDDTWGLTGSLVISGPVGIVQAPDAWSLAGASSATGALAFSQAGDAWGVGGTVTGGASFTPIFWGGRTIRRKTKEEIAEEVREEREALGILPPRVRVEVRKVLPLPDYAREQALREALDEKRIVYLERYTEALLRLAEIEARHREEEELFELLSILP